jgi:DNA-binding GntR family transcriptional regulator
LREEIITGRIPAGEPLPEAKVAEMLGVSRVPVREALALLEREGLVRYDRRGTARTLMIGEEDVRELGLMRIALESLATRLACERYSAELRSSLEANQSALLRTTTLSDVTRLDIEFHRQVFRAAGNQRLAAAWENLASQIRFVMARYHETIEQRTQKTRELTHRGHETLIAALASGDPLAAEAAGRDHSHSWFKYWHESQASSHPEPS